MINRHVQQTAALRLHMGVSALRLLCAGDTNGKFEICININDINRQLAQKGHGIERTLSLLSHALRLWVFL